MSFAKTQSVAEIKARNKELIEEVLQVYPEKTAKRRAGYDGFAIFARDMDMAINAPIWKMAKVPWKSVPKQTLMAAE